MTEELQKSERDELLERLGIYLPKDEEFREMLEREGIGHMPGFVSASWQPNVMMAMGIIASPR